MVNAKNAGAASRRSGTQRAIDALSRAARRSDANQTNRATVQSVDSMSTTSLVRL